MIFVLLCLLQLAQSILRRLVVEYEDCLLLSIFTRHNRNTSTRAFRIIFSRFSLTFWPLTFSRDNFIALHFCKVWRGFYSFPLQLSPLYHLENAKLAICGKEGWFLWGKLSDFPLWNANVYVPVCVFVSLLQNANSTYYDWGLGSENVALVWRLRDFADFVAIGPSLVPTSSKLRRWWVEFLASSEVARGAGVVTTTKNLSGNFG